MGEFNKRCGAYSRKYGTKRYYYGFKRRLQIKHFGEKKLVSFGTFPYALCNLTFTNKLLVKGQNKKEKKRVSLKTFFILHFFQRN